MRAAYSGRPDGFGHQAVAQQYPDATHVAAEDAVEALRLVSRGEADVAVVLFEDTDNGVATRVVDHLVFETESLTVIGETDLVDDATVRRYVAIAQQPNPTVDRPQTLLFVIPNFNRPGTLSELLAALAARGINLTTLQSRPLGGALGMYGFLIEFEGSLRDPLVQGAMADVLAASQFVKHLGTFEEGERRWGHVVGREPAGRRLTQADLFEPGGAP